MFLFIKGIFVQGPPSLDHSVKLWCRLRLDSQVLGHTGLGVLLSSEIPEGLVSSRSRPPFYRGNPVHLGHCLGSPTLVVMTLHKTSQNRRFREDTSYELSERVVGTLRPFHPLYQGNMSTLFVPSVSDLGSVGRFRRLFPYIYVE